MIDAVTAAASLAPLSHYPLTIRSSQKATSVHGLWPAMNPELVLSSLGTTIPASPESPDILQHNGNPLSGSAWILPHTYYVTKYSLSGCKELLSEKTPFLPKSCTHCGSGSMQHLRWSLQGKPVEQAHWLTLHSSDSLITRPDEEQRMVCEVPAMMPSLQAS